MGIVMRVGLNSDTEDDPDFHLPLTHLQATRLSYTRIRLHISSALALLAAPVCIFAVLTLARCIGYIDTSEVDAVFRRTPGAFLIVALAIEPDSSTGTACPSLGDFYAHDVFCVSCCGVCYS
jgi:hypothetical protein